MRATSTARLLRPPNYLERIERVAENLERISPGDYGESHALWLRAQAAELRTINQAVRQTLARQRTRERQRHADAVLELERRRLGELAAAADVAAPAEWGPLG